MTYVFHPAAEAEHLESVAYFESKRPGLGASYLEEFEKMLHFICETPQRYLIEKRPDIRRAKMMRFPFSVINRESSDMIQILAIAHQRRRPQYWFGRL